MTVIAEPRPSRGYILPALTLLTLAAAFMPTFAWMVERFNEAESYYSHGYLIPLVTLYFLYARSAEFKAQPVASSRAGLAILVAGLLMHLAGVLLKIGVVSGFAFIVTLLGLCLYLYGPAVTRLAAVPILFLLFMVPIPRVFLLLLTFKMKLAAAWAAAHAALFIGVPLKHAASIILLPNGTLSVDNECSGINSLISLFTLSIVFAYAAEKSWSKRALFVLISLPVALVSNIFRIVFLILAAYIYGPEAAMNGLLHYGAGMVLWISALGLLILFWRVVRQPQTAR